MLLNKMSTQEEVYDCASFWGVDGIRSRRSLLHKNYFLSFLLNNNNKKIVLIKKAWS